MSPSYNGAWRRPSTDALAQGIPRGDAPSAVLTTFRTPPVLLAGLAGESYATLSRGIGSVDAGLADADADGFAEAEAVAAADAEAEALGDVLELVVVPQAKRVNANTNANTTATAFFIVLPS